MGLSPRGAHPFKDKASLFASLSIRESGRRRALPATFLDLTLRKGIEVRTFLPRVHYLRQLYFGATARFIKARVFYVF